MSKPGVIRKVFAAPLLLIEVVRRSKLDNFFGGLVIGAIFSLLVNVVTVTLQDAIAKQQYLEALEHEIVDNYVEADKTIKEFENQNTTRSTFVFTKRYNSNVWSSGNALTYIYSIDPDVQFAIADYYNTGVLRSNRFLDQLSEEVTGNENEYLRCFYRFGSAACTGETNILNRSVEENKKHQLSEAKYIKSRSNYILDRFHPTKDRLRNPALRFVMGDKAADIFVLDPVYQITPTPGGK